MVCSARVRTALLAVCQEFPQGGCYPGDGHALQGKGPQPRSTAERVSRAHDWARAARVLSPHPAAVGAGEAPQAHHQLRGSPPHRHVGQAPGHRPTGYSLGPAGLAERVRKPDRHTALHNRALDCEELAHSGQSQGARPRKVVRSGSVKVSLRHVEVSQVACVAAPIIGRPRPLPAATTHPPTPDTPISSTYYTPNHEEPEISTGPSGHNGVLLTVGTFSGRAARRGRPGAHWSLARSFTCPRIYEAQPKG